MQRFTFLEHEKSTVKFGSGDFKEKTDKTKKCTSRELQVAVSPCKSLQEFSCHTRTPCAPDTTKQQEEEHSVSTIVPNLQGK